MSEKITAAVEVTVEVDGVHCSPRCRWLQKVVYSKICALFDTQVFDFKYKFARCPECIATFSSPLGDTE